MPEKKKKKKKKLKFIFISFTRSCKRPEEETLKGPDSNWDINV